MGRERTGVNSPVPFGSFSTSASTSSPSKWSSLVSRLSMMLLMSAAIFLSVDVAAWLSALRDMSGTHAPEPGGTGEERKEWGRHHPLCNALAHRGRGEPSSPLPTFLPTIPILRPRCKTLSPAAAGDHLPEQRKSTGSFRLQEKISPDASDHRTQMLQLYFKMETTEYFTFQLQKPARGWFWLRSTFTS